MSCKNFGQHLLTKNAKIHLEKQKFIKKRFFRRCGQNDGGYLEYRSSEHDTLFKTLLRDVFSSKLIHGIISLKFMKKFFFENLTFFIFSAIFTYNFMYIFLLQNALKIYDPKNWNISGTTKDMKRLKLGFCRIKCELSFHDKVWTYFHQNLSMTSSL